jgi:hypothetical protein
LPAQNQNPHPNLRREVKTGQFPVYWAAQLERAAVDNILGVGYSSEVLKHQLVDAHLTLPGGPPH